MTTDPAPSDQSTLRHEIETIAIAVSTIMGLHEPDSALIDAITSETAELLGGQRGATREDHIRLLVNRIAATL